MVSGKPRRVAAGGTHRYVDRFDTVLSLAGITRSVRWHDLRHTCGSSLVAGFWGPPQPLIVVRDMLGHSSVSVTEIYAHLGPTPLKEMAKVVGGQLVGGGGPTPSSVAAISSESFGEPRVGLEPTTCALRKPSVLEVLRALTRENAPSNPLATHLAEALANLLEKSS